jgi:hypothetical protein
MKKKAEIPKLSDNGLAGNGDETRDSSGWSQEESDEGHLSGGGEHEMSFRWWAGDVLGTLSWWENIDGWRAAVSLFFQF